MRTIPIVHIEIEQHPNQDNWGRAEFTVLMTSEIEALAGEPDTNEWDAAFDRIAEAIRQDAGYSLQAYSGGPGRPYKHAPSIRLDEWDGDPAIVITSSFGMDV